MANLFKRINSPFWWVKFRSPSGDLVRQSTGFRHGMGSETKKARELCAKKTFDQYRIGTISNKEQWEAWANNFLETRYASSPNTLARYKNCFRAVLVFLNYRKIRAPRQLRYDDLMAYIEWRKDPTDPGVFKAKLNTTLTDLKVLRIVVREAIRRGYATDNPCLGLGIKKEKPKEKPEITDKEIGRIRAELLRKKRRKLVWPEWMSISFEIALHQGCRLRETCLPLSDVDLVRGTITFNAKGGKRFTTMMHPDLKPLFERLISEKRKMTCDMPHMPSKFWWMLFKELKMRHLCFHSTRVTVITRLARSGESEAKAMRYVGHASTTVHRVYQRLKTEDLASCVAALKMNEPVSSDTRPSI